VDRDELVMQDTFPYCLKKMIPCAGSLPRLLLLMTVVIDGGEVSFKPPGSPGRRAGGG
jgi:hypothetical protein